MELPELAVAWSVTVPTPQRDAGVVPVTAGLFTTIVTTLVESDELWQLTLAL